MFARDIWADRSEPPNWDKAEEIVIGWDGARKGSEVTVMGVRYLDGSMYFEVLS